MNVVAGYNDNKITPVTGTICRFYLRGMCRFGNRCRNIHEELVHKGNEAKTKTPEKTRNLPKSPAEKNSSGSSASEGSSKTTRTEKSLSEFGHGSSSPMEAVILVRKAQSQDKACGICFDIIVEKLERRDQIFGILPNCNHCFCFACIKKWRQSKEFELEVAKACPECRIASEYVYPSKYWLEEKEEKNTFINHEKNRLQKIDCRYFRKGNGKCPFGNTCLYLHALPNGKKLDVGPPRPRRRRSSTIDGELVHQILFWLNDDDLDGIDSDVAEDDDFELDLDDPEIACQYYDHDDIRRYMALDRLMNSGDSDDDSDLEFMF